MYPYGYAFIFDDLFILLHRLSIMHICLEDLETVNTEPFQNRGPLCPFFSKGRPLINETTIL